MIDPLPYHLPLVTIAVTTYNRPATMVMNSFANVLDHPLVDEVVIVDDASDPGFQKELTAAVADKNHRKLSLWINKENIGMSRNKARAISLAQYDWVYILDSDNTLLHQTIDSLACRARFDPELIYHPSWAMPHFDFREYEGQSLFAKDVAARLKERTMSVMLNACNYMVNKDRYTLAYRHNPEVMESDTIWFNYLWLKRGGGIHVVPDMWYEHLVHDGSGWKKHAHQNIAMADRIKALIAQL